ncbi:MAG: hypothetical protein P4N60_05335 [Verrucomicrobiae bacterium]|nr:hypothetical protein [Verrucomicrobiae bacterium]
MKLTTILLIGLALLGGGCASLTPSAAQAPQWEHDQDTTRDAGPVNDWLVYVAYWATYCAGEVLTCR